MEQEDPGAAEVRRIMQVSPCQCSRVGLCATMFDHV